MQFRKSDGGVVPMKVCNASGGKAITTTTALWGDTYRAQYPEATAANDETSTSNSLPRLRGRAGEGVSAKGTAISGEQFSYDGVGNRIAHTQTPEEGEAEDIHAVYNDQNQLISQTKNGVETTFTYNTNGHTARKTTGSETTEYIYNHEERLIAVKKNGTTVGEYAYNPLGQRIKKTANGQTTWYLYNDEGLAAEYNQQGQLIAEYHFTPYSTWMTEPLFHRKGGQVYYYQNDHLGTPQRMINASGEVVWEARYSAFGEAEIIAETVSNNLRFPGQYFDGETGLHHNYFRDYDPVTGRYVQSDPIGMIAGVNYYSYVNGSPLVGFDPLGLREGSDWDKFRSENKGRFEGKNWRADQSQVYRDQQNTRMVQPKALRGRNVIGLANDWLAATCGYKADRALQNILAEIDFVVANTAMCEPIYVQITYHIGQTGCISNHQLQIGRSPSVYSDVLGHDYGKGSLGAGKDAFVRQELSGEKASPHACDKPCSKR